MKLKTTMDANLDSYPDIKAKRHELIALIREFGTPMLVCEKEKLRDRFNNLDSSLKKCWTRTQIAYSFKTNYDVARAGIFQEIGAFAEVVSGREYALARDLGYSGGEIIFNGPYKDDWSLRASIEDGATINVNDRQELQRIIELSSSRRELTPIGIRVSSTLDPFGHSRFGFSMENGEASEAVDTIERAEFVELFGLHSHVYGDTDDESIYAAATVKTAVFARNFVRDFERKLRFVNLGGGFPAQTPKPYSRESWRPKNIEVYVETIADSLKKSFGSSEVLPILVLEPGRYLVNDGIVLLTNVVHVMHRGESQLVNSNGSISMVPLTHYRPQVIRAYSHELNQRTRGSYPTVIYGATCRENDILFEGQFPRVNVGDVLIHFGVGAYNSSLSPNFIFDSPKMFVI